MKKIFYLLSLLVLIFSPCIYAESSLSSSHDSNEKFITVADIHFDPFSACKKLPTPCVILTKLQAANYQQWDAILSSNEDSPSDFGNDTNYALWKLVLTKLKKANQTERPQFVLILGDSIAHYFHDKYIKYSNDKSALGYSLFVKKTLQFLMAQLNQAFPTVNIYSAVGNNDTYTGNYNVVPQGKFLKDTAMTWSLGIKNNNKSEFKKLFPLSGYYAITLPYHQKVLVLNTVLFSTKSKKKDMDIAAHQLQWLTEQLALAEKNHTHVIIAFHIPVSIDPMTSIKLYLMSVGGEFWKSEYKREFKQIMESYSSTVTAILPAHIHIDAYQLMPNVNIPIIFTTSISPIYGNSIGYKVFTYDPKTLNIIDNMTITIQ